jgi:predicted aspartyl protease
LCYEYPLNPQHGLVIVQAAVDGPSGSAVLRLALDTGATGTVINMGMLVALGYDPALVPERIQVTTGSGVEFVPRVSLHQIVALGQERTNFPVLGHTLPHLPVQALTADWGSILCEGRH